jgi:hypothetical protein
MAHVPHAHSGANCCTLENKAAEVNTVHIGRATQRPQKKVNAPRITVE